jgi:hypothetical protein
VCAPQAPCVPASAGQQKNPRGFSPIVGRDFARSVLT